MIAFGLLILSTEFHGANANSSILNGAVVATIEPANASLWRFDVWFDRFDTTCLEFGALWLILNKARSFSALSNHAIFDSAVVAAVVPLGTVGIGFKAFRDRSIFGITFLSGAIELLLFTD